MKIAILYKDNKWYYLDLLWGEKKGHGYLYVLPLGEKRELGKNLFAEDNREQIDPANIKQFIELKTIDILCCNIACTEKSEVTIVKKDGSPSDVFSSYCLDHLKEFYNDENYILIPAELMIYPNRGENI